MSGMNSNSNGDSIMGSEVDARKLVILGLPWETTEASLEQHFSQIGPLQVVLPILLSIFSSSGCCVCARSM